MEAKELRIGNLVYTNRAHGKGEKQKKTVEVNLHYLRQIEDNCNYIKPIPLTEEWLLKFGFNKEPDKSFTKRDIAIFLDKRFSSNLFMQENQGDFTWFSYECKIEYVHQVQNLYFALTGEELILKSE